MKNIQKGVIVFIIAQMVISFAFFILIGNIMHPFSSLNISDTGGHLIKSGLMFLPVYFSFGLIGAKVFKLDTNGVIIGTALCGALLLTASWLLLVVASGADHSLVLLYSILNPSAGLAYMPISNTAGYLNGANLFLTIMPPVAFAFGIGIHAYYGTGHEERREQLSLFWNGMKSTSGGIYKFAENLSPGESNKPKWQGFGVRHIKYLFFAVFPAACCYFFMQLPDLLASIAKIYYLRQGQYETMLVCFYALTIIYIVLYTKFKFAKMWILPVSFAMTPLAVYIYETQNPGWFQYLGTWATAIYYALPFTIITSITAFRFYAKRRQN